MASEKAVIEALVVLETTWPALKSTKAAARAWGLALAPFTDEQVALGTELVMRYHEFGQPAPAHLLGMIRGKTERVMTDSVYAVAYRDEQVFIWEEHGDPPPGGLTNEEARKVLLEPRRQTQEIASAETPALPPVSEDG